MAFGIGMKWCTEHVWGKREIYITFSNYRQPFIHDENAGLG